MATVVPAVVAGMDELELFQMILMMI